MEKSFLPKSVYSGLLIAFGLMFGASGMLRTQFEFEMKEYLFLMIFDLILLSRVFKNIYGQRFNWPDVVLVIGVAVCATGAVSLALGNETISRSCMVVMGILSLVPAMAGLMMKRDGEIMAGRTKPLR